MFGEDFFSLQKEKCQRCGYENRISHKAPVCTNRIWTSDKTVELRSLVWGD